MGRLLDGPKTAWELSCILLGAFWYCLSWCIFSARPTSCWAFLTHRVPRFNAFDNLRCPEDSGKGLRRRGRLAPSTSHAPVSEEHEKRLAHLSIKVARLVIASIVAAAQKKVPITIPRIHVSSINKTHATVFLESTITTEAFCATVTQTNERCPKKT